MLVLDKTTASINPELFLVRASRNAYCQNTGYPLVDPCNASGFGSESNVRCRVITVQGGTGAGFGELQAKKPVMNFHGLQLKTTLSRLLWRWGRFRL